MHRDSLHATTHSGKAAPHTLLTFEPFDQLNKVAALLVGAQL